MIVNDPALSDDASLTDWLSGLREWIDAGLAAALPPAETRPAVVHQAMRYAVLNGGKRLRAVLALECARHAGGGMRRAFRPALALEAFHASTLVHDDLPCMDDDDTRRGQPSTHIRFGEANALLAGNGLLTLALEWMAETPVPPPHPPGILASELARAGGSEGVIGGQIEDLEAERCGPDEEKLLYIHTEKTARLIACACRVGMICGGACASKVDLAGRFGLHLGIAFQILDDILDVTRCTDDLGKPAGSDEARGKLTAVSCWGVEGSRARAAAYTETALAELARLEMPESRLRELTAHLLHRKA